MSVDDDDHDDDEYPFHSSLLAHR